MTANNKYFYDEIHFDKTLTEWVQLAHKYNCENNGWRYFPLKKGAYGFDNLCVCLAKVFHYMRDNEKKNINTNQLCEIIHDGWVENYIYWRDNTPWIGTLYNKPNKPINDERRNQCAILKFHELSEDEKDKDIIIANFILQTPPITLPH